MMESATERDHENHAGLLSAQEAREFQHLVHQTTGVLLDEATAAKRASQLLYLTRAFIGQLPDERRPSGF